MVRHNIDVGDHKPTKQHAYRLNPSKRAIVQQEVKYPLDNYFAARSSSSWSSPSLLVPKPDHLTCTDYREVNAMTKLDPFPLPCMDDCVMTDYD